MRYASKSCPSVMPYLESPGLSMMPLARRKSPPGLKRQLATGPTGPASSSKNGMCEMSSKFTMAPSSRARRKSSAGVSLDENMIFSPGTPRARAMRSSV